MNGKPAVWDIWGMTWPNLKWSSWQFENKEWIIIWRMENILKIKNNNLIKNMWGWVQNIKNMWGWVQNIGVHGGRAGTLGRLWGIEIGAGWRMGKSSEENKPQKCMRHVYFMCCSIFILCWDMMTCAKRMRRSGQSQKWLSTPCETELEPSMVDPHAANPKPNESATTRGMDSERMPGVPCTQRRTSGQRRPANKSRMLHHPMKWWPWSNNWAWLLAAGYFGTGRWAHMNTCTRQCSRQTNIFQQTRCNHVGSSLAQASGQQIFDICVCVCVRLSAFIWQSCGLVTIILDGFLQFKQIQMWDGDSVLCVWRMCGGG